MTSLSSRLHSIHRGLSAREVPPFPLPALSAAVRALGNGPIAEALPASDRLDRLREKIHTLLSSSSPTLKLGVSEWLDAPWLAFERWGEQTLCEDSRFRDGLSYAAKLSPHVGKRCIHVFLRDYDPLAPGATASFGGVIQEALRAGHLSLAAWDARNQRLRIFDADGGANVVVSKILTLHPVGPLTEPIIEEGLASGGFSFAMLLAWCHRAHARPWEKQEVIDTWMQRCRVVGRVNQVVEALLSPWRSQDPEKEWRTSLLAWLQRHHGDPRDAVSGVWAQVDDELRNVAIRWLTLQTIVGFFEVLDDYARRRGDEAIRKQWPYRRAFWLAYYRRGVVLDAKVAVGRDMEEHIGWESLYSRFGKRTARLDASDSQQSALLLRIRGLIVFVGTHNASCRIWDETAHAAPDLRRARFRYSEIVTNPRGDLQIDASANDTGIQHNGAANGTWQRKLRDFLRNKIGVTLQDTEFIP
jgi:hypothetical protein